MIKSLLEFGLTRSAIIVLGLVVFCAAGLVAFSRLNIEAYPNPAPVILEITAQAAGLSAEEMEKYYTIPMEVGLYPTPGVINIRSTSFYGLSFVRVTFKYGVDFYFALTQASISLQQNVNLPGNQVPQIQQSSLVGEIYRYQLVGPPHFGLTNLRTLQDYVVARRMLTIPGVVQINAWGGTTKQFNVDADLQKLEAYNITIPQLVTALGNANINVGGREITVGQQSVNIRGVGLVDSGGADDVTKGYKVQDIENVVLTQVNGLPIQVKHVASVSVGYVPRLGIGGRDHDDDVATAIVVMGRTQHTNDIIPRVQAEVEKLNSDGSLPPGVKIVPYYDRSSLVGITTHTVLHNLIFGCLLVFLIQWVFLGDLRSAIIVSANIPFALFFAIILLVLQGEDANLLSLGAVDFGIIVDSAVIMMENIYRNFQSTPEHRQTLLQHLSEGYWGADPTSAHAQTTSSAKWTERLRIIFASALQVDKAVFFTAAITVTAFVPLFTMQGVEGQIFGPMARTYGYALAGALFATFTVTPVLASLLIPKHIEEAETVIVRTLRKTYTPVLRWALSNLTVTVILGVAFLGVSGLAASRLGSEFLPALEEGNFWIRAAMPSTMSLDAGTPVTGKMREILLRHPEVLTVVSQHGRPDNGSDASPFSNVELFAPLKPFDEWPANLTKEKLTEELQKEFADELPGIGFNFSQYIQDNVEEALSGVKGANSVKVIGQNLEVLEGLATQVMAEMAKIRGVADLGIFHLLGQPNLNIKVDREKAARYGLNTGDVNTVVQAALGGTTATTVLEGDRQFNLAVRLDPKYRSSIDAVRNVKVAYSTPSGTNAYVPLSELADITLDTGSIVHLSRTQPALHSDQVQRARTRSRRHCGRSPGAHRQGRQASERIPNHLGRRIRQSSGRQAAPDGRCSDHATVDPRSLVRVVQLAARQPAGGRRHSLCDRRWPDRTLSGWARFQRVRGNRLHLAVRRRRDGWHSQHNLLPRAQGAGDGCRGSGIPRRRTADAADVDDRLVRGRRAVSGCDFPWHRKPGAAPAGNRRCGWYVHRTVASARCGARAQKDIPGEGPGERSDRPRCRHGR